MPSREALSDALALCRTAGLRGHAPQTDADIARTLETWALVLSDLTDSALRAAVLAHIRTSPWWPAPADLLAPARAALRGPGWEDAWAALVSSPSRTRPPKFVGDQPHVRACYAGLSALGSWWRFCTATAPNEAADRAAFRDGYLGSWDREQATGPALESGRPDARAVMFLDLANDQEAMAWTPELPRDERSDHGLLARP